MGQTLQEICRILHALLGMSRSGEHTIFYQAAEVLRAGDE